MSYFEFEFSSKTYFLDELFELVGVPQVGPLVQLGEVFVHLAVWVNLGSARGQPTVEGVQ